MRRPRPLDRVGSIKVKLGLLVVASVLATAFLAWYGLLVLGWRARYYLPVTVLVGLGLTQLLAHGMTAPLRQMTAAARAMAAGAPAPPVRRTSRDEVGELARAFTSMAEDLARADAQRRALLADVSHELRTPVTALGVQVENLVDGVRPADEQALEEVLVQVHRLSGLLEDLLDLARADGGANPLRRSATDVGGLVRRAAREVAAARGGAAIEVAVPDDLLACVDARRVTQLLTNLLDNACRHAPGGQVAVRARGSARGGAPALVLEVSDDGPGIPPEARSDVFDRFVRGGGHTGEAPTGGTGLGLAIARWVVLLHGGSIGVLPSDTGCAIEAVLPGTVSRRPPTPAGEHGPGPLELEVHT